MLKKFLSILFILAFGLTGIAAGGQFVALLPPIIRVPSAPLYLRGYVYNQLYQLLLESPEYRLCPQKSVTSRLRNSGFQSAWYSYTPEQYRDLAAQLQASCLFQLEISEFQPQIIQRRPDAGIAAPHQFRLHLAMTLYRIDATDGIPRRISGGAPETYDSSDDACLPPQPGIMTMERFCRIAISQSLRQTIQTPR